VQRRDRRYDPYARPRRSKSPQLNYDEPVSNEGIELFPSKVVNGRGDMEVRRNPSSSRSPHRRRRNEQSYPTFSSIGRDRESSDPDGVHDDLFPDKVGNRQLPAMDMPLSLGSRAQVSDDFSAHNGSKALVELFPEKMGQKLSVQVFPEEVGGQSDVELFPEKVGGSLGERIAGKSLAERILEADDDLAQRTGQRRRRRRAEDHF
jgi:hypothetical protein